MGAQSDRVEAQRLAKLEEIEKQVKAGSLTIRKMTDEERARFPPPPPRPRRK